MTDHAIPPAVTDHGIFLDVLVCTFDNAFWLDRVLSALGGQAPAGAPWRVLVVDNNSRDATRHVVARHRARGAIPGLACVSEREQGLTHARLRAVRETSAPWLSFVDDDCLLAEDWIAQAVAFARAHPRAAAFGGRVLPTYLAPPPAPLRWRGWAFAEQDAGDAPARVATLVGAGMVVNREALLRCGWSERPFLADRVGRRLVSGGDVELARRLAATGRPLLYTPRCELRHMIAAHRTAMPYLVRLLAGLGASESLVTALTWRARRRDWARAAARQYARSGRKLLRAGRLALRGGDERQNAALIASYEWGRCAGSARVGLLLATRRCDFFGGVSRTWEDPAA